jgi:hypothetical protein
LVLLPLIAVLMSSGASAAAATIKFSGYDWEIRPSAQNGGPGPNRWDEKNVSVDPGGYLHLKLTERGGKWCCAEVYTRKALGFGLYEFQVVGRVDRLDPNVVFGLFNYPQPEVGPDGTHEIDIEFARWGDPSAAVGNYTVWPVRAALRQTTRSFAMSLGEEERTTHGFTWSPASVKFRSMAEHQEDHSPPLGSWLYEPRNPADRISSKPMPVHINLWCFQGRAPRNGAPVELVVRSFKFTPGKGDSASH